MILRTATLLAALWLAPAAWALTHVQADSLVKEGARLYTAGDHQAALDALLQVEDGFDSPALQLAIGNAWYKSGDAAKAILHYERGLRLAPSDADLRANRDLLASQVKDKLPSDPDHALSRTWDTLRAGADPDQWARRSLWLMLLTCVAIAVARLVKGTGTQRLAYSASAILGLLLVASVGFAFSRHQRMQAHDEAIIMAPRMDARAEPKAGAKTLFILHKGSKVQAGDEADGWTEVRLPNGSVGWMPPGSLERI